MTDSETYVPAQGGKVAFFTRKAGTVRRHFEPALRKLTDNGVDLTIVFEQSWAEPVVVRELMDAVPDATWVSLVPDRTSVRERASLLRARVATDYLRYFLPVFAGANSLAARVRERLNHRAWLFDRAGAYGHGWFRRWLGRRLESYEHSVPAFEADTGLLKALAPDVMLITPLVDVGSGQVDWVKAGVACGIPTGLCVASWDNLSNKGQMRVVPDFVVVWNAIQTREAETIHGMPEGRVAETGAQTFDHWFARQPSKDYRTFCADNGLDPERPFILYLGSSPQIGGDEHLYFRDWLRRLRESSDKTLETVGVLVRPHPRNTAIWQDFDFGDPNVALWKEAGDANASQRAQDGFFDSLHHASAAVGLNTSSQIEAAIAGTPVFCPYSEEVNPGTVETVHFAYLRAESGGPVHVSSTHDEHLRQLQDGLANPAKYEEHTRAFLKSFIRPGGLERPATDLFVHAIEEALAGRINGRPLTLLQRNVPPLDWVSQRFVNWLLELDTIDVSAEKDPAIAAEDEAAAREAGGEHGTAEWDGRSTVVVDDCRGPLLALSLMCAAAAYGRQEGRRITLVGAAELLAPPHLEGLSLPGVGVVGVPSSVWQPLTALRQKLGYDTRSQLGRLSEERRRLGRKARAERAAIGKHRARDSASAEKARNALRQVRRAVEAIRRREAVAVLGATGRRRIDSRSADYFRGLWMSCPVPERPAGPAVPRRAVIFASAGAVDRGVALLGGANARRLDADPEGPRAVAAHLAALGWSVVLVGAPRNGAAADGVEAVSEKDGASRTFDLIGESALVICTSVFHQAAARICGVPCLVLNGVDPVVQAPLSEAGMLVLRPFVATDGTVLSTDEAVTRIEAGDDINRPSLPKEAMIDAVDRMIAGLG